MKKNGAKRPSGPRWTDISVRRILTSPRNAGLVALERETEDDDGEKRIEIEYRTAIWPAIIDRAKWERCREVLTQRAPHFGQPAPPQPAHRHPHLRLLRRQPDRRVRRL